MIMLMLTNQLFTFLDNQVGTVLKKTFFSCITAGANKMVAGGYHKLTETIRNL